MIEPRLLTRDDAKAYLGGCDPKGLVSPVRIGRHVRWDRVAIDAALDRLSGIERAPPCKSEQDEADEALERFKADFDR